MNPPAIEVNRISKRYPNGVEALRDTAITVRQGEIFGLLGANGAGKSTLVKILLNLVRPTHFEGLVMGKPLGNMQAKRRIGYLPEQVRFAEHLEAGEFLTLAGRLHGVPHSILREETKRLLFRVGLSTWEKQAMRNFSKGMRQRLGMAQALINNPDLIFLDEPTDGVDPLGRRDIRELILELKKQGKTIFVNSHLLSELETLCDRVAILKQGEVVRIGSVQELTSGGDRYSIVVAGELLDQSNLTSLVSALGGTISVPLGGGQTEISLATRRAHQVQPIIDELRKGGQIIISVTPVRQSLEDYFLHTVSEPSGSGTLGGQTVAGASDLGLGLGPKKPPTGPPPPPQFPPRGTSPEGTFHDPNATMH